MHWDTMLNREGNKYWLPLLQLIIIIIKILPK